MDISQAILLLCLALSFLVITSYSRSDSSHHSSQIVGGDGNLKLRRSLVPDFSSKRANLGSALIVFSASSAYTLKVGNPMMRSQGNT